MPPKTRPNAQRPTVRRRRPSTPPAAASEFDGIRELAASLNALHRQMAAACAPSVEDIIRSRTRDQRQIEHMLNRLLDCACIPEGLALFRSLCRYYYFLNAAATTDYIEAYREMWDSDAAEDAKA